MTTDPVPETVPVPAEERHASWLELFFDLVSVSGVGMLAHLLAEDTTSGGLALYVIALVAYWLVWASFTTYANIAGEATRTGPMLVGMAALGVMTAAVPEIHGEHATGFAVAYVVGRVAASRPWRSATVVVDLPVVHAGMAVVPWVVSWWFDGTTKYVLWGAGLAIDLVVLLTTTREGLLSGSQARLDRALASLTRRGERASDDARTAPGGRPRTRDQRDADVPTSVTEASSEVPYLGERLGLFILIVLGEGLIQTISAASEARWDQALASTGAGAFALVVGLWALGVHRGFAGLALVPTDALPARWAWAAHLGATATLATAVAVLGTLVAEPTAVVSDHDLRLLSGSLAAYALLSAAVHVAVGLRARTSGDSGLLRRSLGRAATVGVPILAATTTAVLSTGLSGRRLAWLLAWGVLATVVVDARVRRGRRPRRGRGARRGVRPDQPHGTPPRS